jgi:hypothetical protein
MTKLQEYKATQKQTKLSKLASIQKDIGQLIGDCESAIVVQKLSVAMEQLHNAISYLKLKG